MEWVEQFFQDKHRFDDAAKHGLFNKQIKRYNENVFKLKTKSAKESFLSSQVQNQANTSI
jgi:hypothetical protein